jgi:hypothetical protein
MAGATEVPRSCKIKGLDWQPAPNSTFDPKGQSGELATAILIADPSCACAPDEAGADHNNVWDRAAEALANPPPGEEPDPRPLADLLRRGAAPPPVALLLIAELIDPTIALLDFRLIPKRTNAFGKLTARLGRHLRIARAMRVNLEIERTVENAAVKVAEHLSVSERWVLKVWGPISRTWPKLYGRAP